MEISELVKPGRPVVITKGDGVGIVGTVHGWIEAFGKWEVVVGEVSYLKETHELEPLFTMSQVVSVKVAEDSTPALVNAVIPFGMTSEDLAQTAAEYIAACVARIKGVGNDQYSEGGHQKFESMELDDLFVYALEELQDFSNYAVFLAIRLERLRNAIFAVDDLGDDSEEECDADGLEAEDFQDEGGS